MLRYFFINTTILISFIFVGGQILKGINTDKKASLRVKILVGIIYGVFGSALLFFSIRPTLTTMLDLRHIPIIIAVIYSGAVPGFISAVIISAARFLFFPFSLSSLAALAYVFAVALGCSLICRLKTSILKQWIYSIFFSLAAVMTAVVYVLDRQSVLAATSMTAVGFGITILIASFIAYYMSEYIRNSNLLFAQLKAQSTTDFLTGLNNVRQFDNLINKIVNEDVLQKNRKLTVLIIDIDHFKNINDTYGHSAGDAVLRELGDILAKSCRTIDYASRMGGEEFSILMPDCNHEQAVVAAERIRISVENHEFVLPDGMKIHITISIGVSTYPDTVKDLNDLLRQADDSLYKAKRTGRNKVCSIDGCSESYEPWKK